MASIIREIVTTAPPAEVWSAIADIGALHTRLVPGFVVGTVLEPGGRRVTFANGMEVFEPIISVDAARRRLAWTAMGAGLDHYNASVEVFEAGSGARVVWIADLLPDEKEPAIRDLMDQGMAAMQAALDRVGGPAR